MRNKRGIFVGMSVNSIMGKVKEALFMTVCAEGNPVPEGDGEGAGSQEAASAVSVNFEDLVTKARSEEKAKQFKKIEKLEGQVNTLTQQHNDDLLKIAELEKKLEAAEEKLTKAGSGDSEELKNLKKEYESLKKEKEKAVDELDKLKKNPPKSEEEIRNEVRLELEEEYKVKNHRVEILAEHKDDLLVPELVTGTTVEELDASLQAALDRSKEILEKAGGVRQESAPAPQPRRRAKAPVTTGADFNSYSIDYLATLDPRSPEYKEFRRKAGLK